MIFTGGTISMVMDEATGAARPALSGEEIVARVPELRGVATVAVEDFGMHPGPHMGPERMLALAGAVSAALTRGVAGVVVTHGTDTLEETAFLLDLALAGERPVVLTGAMKTASDVLWDGPANLLGACRVAADPAAGARGVLVVLDGKVHAAREVTKTDTEAAGSFRSPRTGPIGSVDPDGVFFHARPERREGRGPIARLETRVDLIAAAVGSDDRLLRASLDSGARGIVITAFGRGNVPPGLLPGIRAAIAGGVPVVIATRCATGRVGPSYGYDGGGQMLRALGCILSAALPPAKARLLLMVLLGGGASPLALRAAFERG
jgi:L-asparaginase